MSTFTPGQPVRFSTNFYTQPEQQEGTGIVQRIEACQSEDGCKCGAGNTVFVTIDGTDLTAAYVGKELSPL